MSSGWRMAPAACRTTRALIYKVLGRETATVKAAVRAFWAIAREECAGAEIPAPFLWR